MFVGGVLSHIQDGLVLSPVVPVSNFTNTGSSRYHHSLLGPLHRIQNTGSDLINRTPADNLQALYQVLTLRLRHCQYDGKLVPDLALS